ncbi:MAG TPA: DUF1559 domain-containing protein [Pirellulales bacterium]|nr:DUF1559 domain-containing protein [Pirellulales bacterium]
MRRRDGFTLIELLVVIAVIGLLVGLLLPAVQAAREATRRNECANRLKQIGLACQSYHDVMNRFPPGYCAVGAYMDGQTDTSPGWGWASCLLPYLEQQALQQTIDFRRPIEHPVNGSAVRTSIASYLCPSDIVASEQFSVPDAAGQPVVVAAPSSYAGCVGNDASDVAGPSGSGVFYRNSATRLADLTDGSSVTILVGERAWANAQSTWAGAVSGAVCLRGKYNRCPVGGAAWAAASTLNLAHAHLNNATADPDGGLDDFSSLHPEGSNFVFADGSVRFLASLPDDTPAGMVFQGLGTRSGGEVISGDWLR